MGFHISYSKGLFVIVDSHRKCLWVGSFYCFRKEEIDKLVMQLITKNESEAEEEEEKTAVKKKITNGTSQPAKGSLPKKETPKSNVKDESTVSEDDHDDADDDHGDDDDDDNDDSDIGEIEVRTVVGCVLRIYWHHFLPLW